MFFFFGFVSCISTVTCYSSVRFTPYAGLQLLMSFWVWALTELPWWLPCFHRKVAPSFVTVKEPTPNQYKNCKTALFKLTVCTWRGVGIFPCILLLMVANEEFRPAALPLCVLTTMLDAVPVGTVWPVSTIPEATKWTTFRENGGQII